MFISNPIPQRTIPTFQFLQTLPCKVVCFSPQFHPRMNNPIQRQIIPSFQFHNMTFFPTDVFPLKFLRRKDPNSYSDAEARFLVQSGHVANCRDGPMEGSQGPRGPNILLRWVKVHLPSGFNTFLTEVIR